MKVGISLGTNQGDRELQLVAATKFLRSVAKNGLVRFSNIYQTSPVNCPPEAPHFLNMAALMDYDGDPFELLKCLKSFEEHQGRPRDHAPNAPRPIDLDIIFFGNVILNDPNLIIPHPRAAERKFVLVPLADLEPGFVFPGHTQTVKELANSLQTEETLEIWDTNL